MKTLSPPSKTLFAGARVTVFFLLTIFGAQVRAVIPGTGDPPPWLDRWAFNRTNSWESDLLYAPIDFTNVVGSDLGDFFSVVVDSTNNAWLHYNAMVNGTNEITVAVGSSTFWFAPNWSSTNQDGGTGPGEWSRLLEIGSYTTNASYGWWSLYLDPAGANIYFSAQSNDGSGGTYLSAPISWTSNYWHLIGLSYSSSNTSLYLDGELVTNGLGMTVWPSLDVLSNGFYIGSDSNGLAQAHGMFDDLVTYDHPVDDKTVANAYFYPNIFYYGNPNNFANLTSAPSTLSLTPTFNAITGPGYLTLTNIDTLNCITNSNVWITNLMVATGTNGTRTVTFTISGGLENVYYDVFANSILDFSTDTARAWAWMGQGLHCRTYQLTILSNTSAFLILGKPQDSDSDGLTDAYENLVSKTLPNFWDTDADGKGDGMEAAAGTDPLKYDFPSSLELPAVGSTSLRILAPDLIELVRITADTSTWNFIINVTNVQTNIVVTSTNYVTNIVAVAAPPSTNQFQVKSGNSSVNVTQVGFKRRPLYAPITHYDLRIENTLYLRLASTNWAASNATIEVTTTNTALWASTNRFVCVNDPLRYSPAIHVNQAGYLPNFQKEAMVGYYLGSLGEMQISTNLGFKIVDATGAQVYPGGLGSLIASIDDFDSWGTAGTNPIPQYQAVLQADFTSFNTVGEYRLVVPGLGASYPFRIDAGIMMDLARTYALGLYHQRCGSATNGLQVNDPLFTRFSHPACHTTNASVPLPVTSYQNAWVDTISNKYGNATYTGNLDNPPQLAPAVTNYSAVLFGYSNNPTLGIDVSGGHHDAGDYSKYTLNSAMLIHLLTFAADNLGLTNFDNFGLPESTNGIPDILDEAKWEADFLAKMQDTDGGFYFLVYPQTGEYDGGGQVLPQNGDPQIVWPKTTSATAAAVGALAEIGSSLPFRRYFGTNVANSYLAKAQLGWAFLTNAINRYGKDGCYQRLTHYGDDFTHDDELAWAAASLFAATGNTNYYTKLLKWFPNPADTNGHNGFTFKRYDSTNNFPSSTNLHVAVAYVPKTNDVFNTTNKMTFIIFDSEGQKVVTNRIESAIPHISDIPVISNKLYNLKVRLNQNPNDPFIPSALDEVSSLVGNCHTTWRFGWWHCAFGYGCAVRDYAFAVRSGRLTNALNAAYLQQCESEITNRAADLRLWSAQNAYGTSLDRYTKNAYSPISYFAGERTFDLAVADRILPDPANTNAIIENLNYEAGRNPINVSRITGLGSYRQREIVDQFSQNNPLAVLPKSGVPLGNLCDSLYNTPLYGYMDPLCFPNIARGSNFFALYDRWSEVHNVNTEFVHPQTAMAFIAAAYLVTSPSLKTQVWQRASGSIVFPNGVPTFGSRCVAQLTSTQDLSQGQIAWDPSPAAWNFLGQNPAFGTNFTFIPANVGDQRTLQAEAVLPDGRRIFVVTNFAVWDPINGGTNFVNDANTVALYHFDDTNAPLTDSSGHGYTLAKYTNANPGVVMTNNANWKRNPTGYVARFLGSGNTLQASIPTTFLPLNPGSSVTFEGRIYPRSYQPDSGNIFTLYQVYNSGNPPTATQLGTYYVQSENPDAPKLMANAFPMVDASVVKQYLTPNTWHSLKMTFTSVGTNGTSRAYIDGTLIGSTNSPPIFSLNFPWNLILGDFDGDIDEVRVSNILRP